MQENRETCASRLHGGKELAGALMLCLTALIWGVAFVAQKSGMDHLGACAFNGIRSIIGGLVLIPCVALIDRLEGRRPSIWGKCSGAGVPVLLRGGLVCGLVLGLASILQQKGLADTSVGKAGFITTLYIFIVPLLGLFLGRKVGVSMWICVAAAVGGMYLLCFKGGDSGGVCTGDLMVLACSMVFSFHILAIDHFAPRTDCVRMSCLQFFTAGVFSLLCALCFENTSWRGIKGAWLPLLYTGVMSSGIGYTLQTVAQKNVHPALASLVMSLESVFAALGGWLIKGETLSGRELAGCCIIFGAVVMAQLSAGTSGKKS